MQTYDVEKMATFIGKTYEDYFENNYLNNQNLRFLKTGHSSIRSENHSKILNPYETNLEKQSPFDHEKYLDYIRKNQNA